MSIWYDEERKALPIEPLHRLFMLAGWSDGQEPPELLAKFDAPFRHSTLVVSAWENDRLIGVVRVLSDTVTRSILYDLVVDPAYRKQGVGGELLRRCIARYPKSEWLVQTQPHIAAFYERQGFHRIGDVLLHIPSAYFG